MRKILILSNYATDVFRGVNTYNTMEIVEDYDSLIWTERYRLSGDFKITFKENLDDRWSDFSPYVLIAVSDSPEVMIVEDRAVEETDDGEDVLTITGRTFETFLEGRVARPQSGSTGNDIYRPLPLNNSSDKPNNWTVSGRTSASIVKFLADYWTTTTRATTMNLFKVKDYQIIQEVTGLISRSVLIEPGSIYERIIEVLAMDDLGIRNERPQGQDNVSKLVTRIYAGRDLTKTVAFSYKAGHFKKASYGHSVRELMTDAWTFSYNTTGWRTKYAGTGSNGIGFQAKVGYAEMSDLKQDASGSFTEVWDLVEAMQGRGDAYLNEHRPQALFAVQLADDIPFTYGVDFELGDMVTALGRFNTGNVDNGKLRVVEHIRISDQEGEREYSTLDTIKPASQAGTV